MAEIHPEHPREKIVNSDVFRYINLRIDRNASMIEHMCRSLTGKEMYQHEFMETIELRVGEERVEDSTLTLPVGIGALKRARQYLDEIEKLMAEIDRLSRDKMVLLNDWDWTKGNPAQQIAVFGEPDDNN